MGFREYFLEHAALADELFDRGFRLNCYLTATAALDALAEIWESDFPQDAAKLRAEFGGTVPGAVRLSRFIRHFVSGDPRATTIAVIRFAEDALRFAPHLPSTELHAMLDARKPPFRALPPAYKDVDFSSLEREAPILLASPSVRRLVEEYHYPALLYSLYRCPTVHTFGWSKQSQGFARDEEVFYMPLHPGFTSIGFGHRLVTNWLRATVDSYVKFCDQTGTRPADKLNPGSDQEKRLAGKWAKT